MSEEAARDAALDLLQQARGALVAHAYRVAVSICQQRGVVSATDVWSALEAEAKTNTQLAYWLSKADRRWMGVVFRPNRGWVEVQRERTGSHKRSVPIWTRSR